MTPEERAREFLFVEAGPKLAAKVYQHEGKAVVRAPDLVQPFADVIRRAEVAALERALAACISAFDRDAVRALIADVVLPPRASPCPVPGCSKPDRHWETPGDEIHAMPPPPTLTGAREARLREDPKP